MSILDWATLVAGFLGLVFIVIGAGMIYLPAGFIVAGVGLVAWSYIVARAQAPTSGKG
jgi:hypothetical protein